MLPNSKVEDYTAEEIKNNVIKTIIEYFELEPTELNELVINRIDIHCDYNFDDKEEFIIIRNILKKAPDNLYTYKKYLLKDDGDGYILKYLAVRKNKYVQEIVGIEDDILVIDKEKETKNNESNE